MTLSRKIVLVIVSTFIALIFIIAVTSDIILLNSFANLEKKVLKDNVLKVANEMEESFPELDASAKDYSDTLQQGGEEKIANLDIHSFTSHRIDFIACYSSAGELLATRAADFHGQHLRVMTRDQLSDLRQAFVNVLKLGGTGRSHGFLKLGREVTQIAFCPFVNGSVIVVGKYIDKEEVQRISELTKFVIHVSPVGVAGQSADFVQARIEFSNGASFHTSVTENNLVSGYSLFKDLFDKPVLLLKVTEPRLIYEQGKISITYILFALVVSGGVFCVVMLLFMRDTVLKRLATLISKMGDISRHGDISDRLEINGEDELEDLASSINSMLSSLEAAEHALKESEERYRALFERAPDSIIIIGAEGEEAGRIVDANVAAAAQHGYSVEELCSLTINDLNTPETNLIAGALMERIANGEWITCELWHLRKDGSQFPIEVHTGPFRIGGRTYILGFDREITSRKLAEESDRMYLDQISQLNTALGYKASELAVANKELESFNYSVSHDMRGPLTRISGYCQLMLDDVGDVDPQIRTYLQRIYESCCWLDEMLDAMLKLSQLARTDFVLEEVDLSAIVADVVGDLSQAEPDRAVDVHIAPGVVVTGDARLLKILVGNLINNSWKYSARSERAKIEFGVDTTGLQPIYFIRDNGVGFDMKNADKLFRVFTRLHDPAQFSGSGIGLATVQRVIARHGGKVWAEGEVGHGATFYFTLSPYGLEAKRFEQVSSATQNL